MTPRSETNGSFPKRSLLRRCFIGLWLAGCIAGVVALTSYSNTASPVAAAPKQLSSRAAGGKQNTLLLFLHPACPCSKASVRQLERIMAQCRGRLVVRAYFLRPETRDDAWVRTELWKSAERIPGVTALVDPGGMTARLFHVHTSGHALLYARDNALRFSGGLTAGRGHEGDNRGSTAVIRHVQGDRRAVAQAPVFGCRLFPSRDGQSADRREP